MSISDSIYDEIDEMPTTFEEKKALSESFLRRALQGLLIESRKRNVLTEPYGRPVQPTPLLNLTEFLNSGGLDEPSDDTVNDDPIFSYDYGFDPLQYLANYLKFLHPTNIRKMKDERVAIVDRLRFRAAHAKNVLDRCEELKTLTQNIRSGVLWGPFTSPSSSSTSPLSAVICACRVVKEGDLIVQISKDSAFIVVENTWTQTVTDRNITQKILLPELHPGTKYFVRCCLSDTPGGDLQLPLVAPEVGISTLGLGMLSIDPDSHPDLDINVALDNRRFKGVAEGYFQSTAFVSCPSDEEAVVEGPQDLVSPVPVDAVVIVALTVSQAHLTIDSLKLYGGNHTRVSDGDYIISCLLGDVFSAPVTQGEGGETVSRSYSCSNASRNNNAEWYRQESFNVHRFSNSLIKPDSILRNSSMLLAWHDRSPGSDIFLNDEEMALKQFSSDMKKYQSKYGKSRGGKLKQRSSNMSPEPVPPLPRLKKLRMTPELTEVLQCFPLDLEQVYRGDVIEDPTIRQLYSTSMLGPYVQLFVLDYRRGYLGKDQVSWLTEALTNSTARFKVILSGTPFGVSTATLATVGESNGILDKSGKIYTASAAGREGAPGTVSMQIPPPVASLGWDDSGRLNLSLAAVIAAYQLLCLRRKADKRNGMESRMESRQSNSEEVSTAQRADIESERGVPDVNTCTAACQQLDTPGNSVFVSLSSETELESGIVILSAGACVPVAPGKPVEALASPEVMSPQEQKRKSLSNSNDSFDRRRSNPAGSRSGSTRNLSLLKDLEVETVEWNKEDSDVCPFAAVYDPCGSGKPICFEISVGTRGDGGGSDGRSPALLPVVLPYLGGKLLYIAPISPGDKNCTVPIKKNNMDTYSTVVSLSDDGYSLDVRLLAVQKSQEHDVLFRHRLKIPR